MNFKKARVAASPRSSVMEKWRAVPDCPLRLRLPLILSLAAALAVAACTHQKQTPEATLKQGVAEMRSSISQAVADPRRRDQLLGHADRFESVLGDYARDYEVYLDKLHQANRGYDTTRGQIEALFEQFEAMRQATRAQMLDLHFQILQLTSREEWEHVAKGEIRMLEVVGALPPGTPEKKGEK
jgi:hypothetical protein